MPAIAEPPKQESAAAPPQSKQPTAPFNTPFAEIEALFDDEPEAPPDKPPVAELKAPKPESRPEAKPGAKPPEKPQPKPDDKASGPKELRAAYESSSKRVKELEAEREKWSKPAEDPEKKTLSDRLETVEKRRKELEEEIRYAAYERSEEYKEKHLAPLQRAVASAYEDVSKLTIDGTDGKATPGHLQMLCRMELPIAISTAREWFGEAATEVLAMRRHINELRDNAEGAVEQFRKVGIEREQQHAEMLTKQQDSHRKALQQYIADGIEKHPSLFKPADDDAEGKRFLKNGMEFADAGFNGSLAGDQRIQRHADIRNKAGGYDYAVYRWRASERRVKELESKLSEYESSDPGEGSGKRIPKDGPKTFEQEIDELVGD